jgi:hypothetical protein
MKLFCESAAFKQYMSVNKRFAEVIIANYREGDISLCLLLPLLCLLIPLQFG